MMLGIDVSKAALTGTFLDAAQQPRWTVTVPNSCAGVRQLLRRTPATSPWVVEPTGPYSTLVVRQAQAAERTVLLAPTKHAKAFLAALSPRAKTDRVDSYGLARYALAVPLRPFPVKGEVVEQVEQLVAARKGLTQSRMRLRQQRAAPWTRPSPPWRRRSRCWTGSWPSGSATTSWRRRSGWWRFRASGR